MNALLFVLLSLNSFAYQVIIKNSSTQKPLLPRINVEDQRPFVWIPNVKSYRHTKKDKEGIIFDYVSNMSKHGYRVTSSSGNEKKHLFFTGCSITFGQGIADEETFPYLVSKDLKNHHVINMGLRGAGIHDQLFFWRAMNFAEIFSQEEGMMIYTIIPDHFARFARSWRYLNWAFPFSTTYDYEDGEFIYKGILQDNLAYRWSNFVKDIGMSYWWLRMTSLHSDYMVKNSIDTTVKLILELKKTYLKQYPKGKFVLTWLRQPLIPFDHKYDDFKNGLTKAGIEYWEPQADDKDILESLRLKTWHIPRDGHPTAKANELHHKFLMKRIKL